MTGSPAEMGATCETTGFGPKIQKRRKELGLTLRDVEQITEGKISNAYLSQLENGKVKNPSASIVLTLATVYHVSVEETMRWLGEEPAFQAPSICQTCGQVIPHPLPEGER